MFTDYVLNGQGNGEVGAAVANMRFDPGLMRPFIDRKGHSCVTVNTGRLEFNEKLGRLVPVHQKMTVREAVDRGIMPVQNAQTLIRKDEWLAMDRIVLDAARQRLRAWADVASRNTFGVPGMTKTVLEHERMTDAGEAWVDMDGLTEGNSDQAKFQLEGLPLPMTHSGFHFSKRELAVSRQSGTPMDSTQAEMAGRRVAEEIEKTLIGTATGMTYGDKAGRGYDNTPTVYGYTNHPDRITYANVTTPTGVATADDTVNDVLAMRQAAYDQNFYGPFMLYHSSDWDLYLDNDYGVGTPGATAAFAPNQTLRSRLRQIEGVQDVRRLDFFTGTKELLLVQMTSDVVRAVNGMDLTTVQWEEKGGLLVNFKVMAIQVPQIRSQYIGQSQVNSGARCGIVHGTTS